MTIAEIIVTARVEGWHIRPPSLEAVPIFAVDGMLAGFFCPHPAGRGRTRVGPIYVLPHYRGQRLAEQAYAGLAGTPLVAYVHEDNIASQRLHERCGFARWRRGRGGWYWRRD